MEEIFALHPVCMIALADAKADATEAVHEAVLVEVDKDMESML